MRGLRSPRRHLAVLRTDGPLQAKATAWARWGLVWVALGVALVSLATPLVSETVDKWFDFPRTAALMVLPGGTAAIWLWIWANLGKSEWKPFAGAAIYILAFVGLAYSLFPFVLIIDRLTIWEAAAHPSALVFVLVGTLIVLPFIIGGTIYAYRVFRGKARAPTTTGTASSRSRAPSAARARRGSARRL